MYDSIWQPIRLNFKVKTYVYKLIILFFQSHLLTSFDEMSHQRQLICFDFDDAGALVQDQTMSCYTGFQSSHFLLVGS
jgi:hypothetical protein